VLRSAQPDKKSVLPWYLQPGRGQDHKLAQVLEDSPVIRSLFNTLGRACSMTASITASLLRWSPLSSPYSYMPTWTAAITPSEIKRCPSPRSLCNCAEASKTEFLDSALETYFTNKLGPAHEGGRELVWQS